MINKQRILSAMTKAGVEVTPAMLDQVWRSLAPNVVTDEPAPAVKQPTPEWQAALDKLSTQTSVIALEDRIDAANKPGGKRTPVRWSQDAFPDERGVKNKITGRKVRHTKPYLTPIEFNPDASDFDKIMAAMAQEPPKKTKRRS